MSDRPPRYYNSPRLRTVLLVCWLVGHAFVRTNLVADRWGNHTWECVRCGDQVKW